MTPAVFYGRFSHEDSTDKSIEDQRASGEVYAKQIGATIRYEYTDHAITGASVLVRPGVTVMMRDLERLSVKVLIVDHLDRLTRDEADMGAIYRQLAFLGIELHSVAHGRVDRNMAAILALVGRNQLESTAHAVKRGQRGQIKKGKNAGGRPYGYLVVGRNGDLASDEGDDTRVGEALIVRRIYRERRDGRSPREIAARLNRDGIPGPRGGKWNASTLNGSRSRRNGILRNPIYVGIREWNRVSMTRHPGTGKRVSRPNKVDDVLSAAVPELAIIDRETFDAVQQMFPSDRAERPEGFRRAKTVLTGLLKCGCCGGGLSMKDKSAGRIRVQCSTMKESSSCSNRSTVYLDDLLDVALSGLSEQLKQPKLLESMVKAFNAERLRLSQDTAEKHRILEKKLATLNEQQARLWQDYDSGLFGADIAGPRLSALAESIKATEREVASLPSMPENVALHPGSVHLFASHVDGLLRSFDVQITDANRDAAEAVRKLLDKVVVTPSPEGFDVEVHGTIGLLIGAAESAVSRGLLGGTMVAEEGLEPPTRGL